MGSSEKPYDVDALRKGRPWVDQEGTEFRDLRCPTCREETFTLTVGTGFTRLSEIVKDLDGALVLRTVDAKPLRITCADCGEVRTVMASGEALQ